MRICVFGAGATGGHFAARLAAAGRDVSVVARGPHLEAILADGLTLMMGDEEIRARVRASASAGDLGVQDVVIVGVKATGLAAAAPSLAPLVGPDTLVVFPQNGMPWWYPLGLSADRPAPPDIPVFRLAEPLLSHMDVSQVVGGTIYSANEVDAPGVIRNSSFTRNRLALATIDGRDDPRVDALRAAFEEVGITSEPIPDIRDTMWQKLLMNMSGSVIALATGNPSSVSRDDPALREIYLRMLAEGMSISAAHGYPLDGKIDPDAVLAGVPHHKPSLLQDYEQGRPMEIGEIVAAPAAFARAAGIATPTLDVLAAVVSRLAGDRGLYSA